MNQSTDIDYIYHITTIDALYKILECDNLIPRAITGVPRGFSSENEGDSHYIYLTLNKTKPLACDKCVHMIFNGKLLTTRTDYILNTIWSYGQIPGSLPPEKLDEFL